MKTSPSPPLASIAANVCGSCQIARRKAAPTVLMTTAMTDVTTPASAPARRELDRQAAQKPAHTKIPAVTAVNVVDRAWKSAVGTSQSTAVLATNAAPRRAAHIRLSRHANPATCATYHRSARRRPLAGWILSRYSSRRSPVTVWRSCGGRSTRRTLSAHCGGVAEFIHALSAATWRAKEGCSEPTGESAPAGSSQERLTIRR